MESLSFPRMFTSARTTLSNDHNATLSNLKLLLASERNSLLGDPYFGTLLKRIIFSPNDSVLADIVIDEIYTSILTFMPQLKLSRNDISISSDGSSIYATIRATNLIDFQLDTYNINLTSEEGI